MNSTLVKIIEDREIQLNFEIKKILKSDIKNYDNFIDKIRLIKYFLYVIIATIIVFTGYYLYKNLMIEFYVTVISLFFFVNFYQILLRLKNLVNEKIFIQRVKNL